MKLKNRPLPTFLSCLAPLATAATLLGTVISVGAQSEGQVNRQVITNPTTPNNLQRQTQTKAAIAHAPLSFETNRGQTDPSVRYLSHGPGYTLFLTSNEAVFAFQNFELVHHSSNKPKLPKISPPFRKVGKTEVIRVGFEGASSGTPKIEPAEELPGRTNYFIGNKPANWHTDIPAYRRATYTDLYPGVDLVYYGNQGQLEFDFKVKPGADPRLVQMRFDGAEHLEIGSQGELRIKGLTKEVLVKPPSIYQMIGGKKKQVSGRFELRGSVGAGFNVDEYDHRQPLVIDPVLTYSTFFGGTGNDWAAGVALDSQNNIYITGATTSTDFPVQNAYTTVGNTNGMAFVSKFDPTGTTLLYSSYFGGSKDDYGTSIAADSSGNAYVTGRANSPDFPVQNGFQTSLANPSGNAFVARFDTTQTGTASLVYSTYLGGGGNSSYAYSSDSGNGIATDQSGNAYVTGLTTSDTSSAAFPTTVNALQSSLGSIYGNAFLTVANTNAIGSASLVYSSYLGGGSTTSGDYGSGIALDSAGNAYITGFTSSDSSSPFPTTATAFQLSLPDPAGSGFITELSISKPGQQALIYSTYFGGSTGPYGDYLQAIALDAAGKVYVTGEAYSSDFPVTAGAFQTTNSAGGKALMAKFDIAQSGQQSLIYSTYVGGSTWDEGYAIAADASGNAFIAGETGSNDFPTTTDALFPLAPGPAPAFLSELNPSGTGLLYSTYLGGSCGEWAAGVTLDTRGNPVATGGTCSSDFPTTVNAYQPLLDGGYNAFLAKFALIVPTVSGVAPISGRPGDTVMITGTNFGSSQSDSTVTFNGIAATISSWNATTIDAVVPSGATTGDVVVTVSGAASNGIPFTVHGTPAIATLSPNSGTVGTLITIGGIYFGATQATSTLTFNGVAATPVSWSDATIVVPVPIGALSGNVIVTVGGVASTGAAFTVIPTPIISGITPNPASIGTQIAISGSNFGSSQGSSTVNFTGAQGSVSNWSGTTINLVVPSGTVTGNVTVTVAGLSSNPMMFAVPGTDTFTPTASPMITARTFDTATLLTSGKVLIIGGLDSGGNVLSSTELYDPILNTITSAASLNTERFLHTATLLTNGMVLVAGGQDSTGNVSATAELYDPTADVFIPTGSLNTARADHTASLLATGQVLIAGGSTTFAADGSNPTSSAELYDYGTQQFTPTANMQTPRQSHTATVLNDGTVLLVGGSTSTTLADLYYPSTGSFSTKNYFNVNRTGHTATLLNNGQVLIAGGLGPWLLYDPTKGTFQMPNGGGAFDNRIGATASLLNNGSVLIAGGFDLDQNLIVSPFTTEVYDPVAESDAYTGSLSYARGNATAVLLSDGEVFITGGETQNDPATAVASNESFAPSTFAPSGLVSISLNPNSASLEAGAFQSFKAVGTFSDNSTEVLASATWMSSNNQASITTSDATDYGRSYALALGSANVSACTPPICGSASVITTTPAPLGISGLTPSAAPVGTLITISGTGFRSLEGGSTVTFNGLTVTPADWTETNISVLVPTLPPGSANIVVNVAGKSINAPPFVVLAIPVISSLSASAGHVGQVITVTGVNFGASQGDSSITFNGIAATTSSWSDTTIVVPVPTNAATGNVIVTVAGIPSSPVSFTIISITGLYPSAAAIGANITITGTGFGTTQGAASVNFNGTPSTPVGWWITNITVPVPVSATSGPVVVEMQGGTSNSFQFAVSPGIAGISPNIGSAGTPVTITGTSFGGTQASSVVTFNGVPAVINSWSDESIGALVPSGTTTGLVQVIANGVSSNGILFGISPSISSLSASAGPVGMVVQLYGSNFGPSGSPFGTGPTGSSVTFNGIAATPTFWLPNMIQTNVPTGATTGPVVVTVGGASSNSVTFAVGVGSITGTVTKSSNGSAVSGARVLAFQSGSVIVATGTAANGTYTLSNLNPGTYDLQFLYSGLETQTVRNLSVQVNSPLTVNESLGSGGTISGSVIKVGGGGISGAQINALQGPESAGGAIADGSGNFTIPNLGAGSYTVTASADGFAQGQISAAVTEGNTSTANFTLTGQSTITYTYDEVGRLVGVVDSLNGAATYTYDAVGNITSIGRTSQGQISIISFSPKTGVAGTNVTISGSGLNADPNSNTVTFNGTGATVISASPTQIVVAVPAGASTGPISVSNSGGSATSSGSFTMGTVLLSPTTLSSSDGQTVTTTFTATAGGRATVHVTNDYLSTIFVQLLDPNNNVISSTYNYGTFDLPSANLSVAGSYTISVQPEGFLFSGPASGSVTISATNP